MSGEAIQAITRLNKAGFAAFITCESDVANNRYEVVCKFPTLAQAQEFHSALIECGEAYQMMTDEIEAVKSR